MKRFLLSLLLIAVCFTLSAAPASDFVIRLLNGVTLENATIDSMSGSRVIVTGRLPDGSITTKTVSFSDLTPESRDAVMWQMRDRLMLDSKPGWFFSGPAVAVTISISNDGDEAIDVSSAMVSLLAAGDELQVIAVGRVWSRVIDLTTGQTGYMANDYMIRK